MVRRISVTYDRYAREMTDSPHMTTTPLFILGELMRGWKETVYHYEGPYPALEAFIVGGYAEHKMMLKAFDVSVRIAASVVCYQNDFPSLEVKFLKRGEKTPFYEMMIYFSSCGGIVSGVSTRGGLE